MQQPEKGEGGAGLTVFVVEDEALVALNLEDMLMDLGCRIIGPVMRLSKARELMEQGVSADVAILDVNVAGELVYPLAEQLCERGIPIIFATGYGRAGLPEAWHGNTILQKPYTLEDVSGSLKRATGA
jgi:two-component SAPR family response regulator